MAKKASDTKEIASVDAWIEGTFSGSAGLVAMLATERSRDDAAVTIMGRYGSTSPLLKSLIAQSVDPVKGTDEARLGVIRGALGVLARKYDKAIQVYRESLPSAPVRDNEPAEVAA